MLVRRDTRAKKPVSLDTIGEDVNELLMRIQEDMLIAARDRREQNSIRKRISYDDFRALMEGKGGFVYAGWCETCEARQGETKATFACFPTRNSVRPNRRQRASSVGVRRSSKPYGQKRTKDRIFPRRRPDAL